VKLKKFDQYIACVQDIPAEAITDTLVNFVVTEIRKGRGHHIYLLSFPRPTPAFWVSVSSAEPYKDSPVEASDLAYEVCMRFGAELSEDEFKKLTSKKYWPNISSFEGMLFPVKSEESISGKNVDGTASDFQKRCVDYLALYWKRFDHNDEEQMKFFTQRPKFLACMFPKMLENER